MKLTRDNINRNLFNDQNGQPAFIYIGQHLRDVDAFEEMVNTFQDLQTIRVKLKTISELAASLERETSDLRFDLDL